MGLETALITMGGLSAGGALGAAAASGQGGGMTPAGPGWLNTGLGILDLINGLIGTYANVKNAALPSPEFTYDPNNKNFVPITPEMEALRKQLSGITAGDLTKYDSDIEAIARALGQERSAPYSLSDNFWNVPKVADSLTDVSFDSLSPNKTISYFKDAVESPMKLEFENTIKPQIEEAAAMRGAFFGSQRQNEISEASTKMATDLAAKLAEWQQSNQQLSAQLSLEASKANAANRLAAAQTDADNAYRINTFAENFNNQNAWDTLNMNNQNSLTMAAMLQALAGNKLNAVNSLIAANQPFQNMALQDANAQYADMIRKSKKNQDIVAMSNGLLQSIDPSWVYQPGPDYSALSSALGSISGSTFGLAGNMALADALKAIGGSPVPTTPATNFDGYGSNTMPLSTYNSIRYPRYDA